MFIPNRDIPTYSPLEDLINTTISKYIQYDSEKEFIIKGYFDSIYSSGNFLKSIYFILVEKDGFCEEGAACYYSEMYPIDKYFEGVRFEVMGIEDPEYQVDVKEEICFLCFQQACARFIELHSEKKYKDFLGGILNNWSPR